MGKQWMGLTVVFLLVFGLRLYFAFQTPFFSSDQAYLHIRAAEAIQSGKLLWNDPLSYGGRTLIMSPVFDAILAFFSLFMPFSTALKIIPNLFASLLVIPVFLIAQRLTKHTAISIIIALIASLVPAFFAYTFNHISFLTLALPMFFFLTYAWLRVPQRKWVITFLSFLLIFVFLTPLSIIFVLSIGVYIALATIEHLKIERAEYELGLFSLFFALWAQFLLYKKLILFHGPAVVWRNIPQELLSQFFREVNILGALWQIGFLPLTGGIYALYKTAFKKPQKEIQILLSIAIVSTVVIWFKLIDLPTGFMLLGITLTLLFSKWIMLFSKFINETKLSRYATVIVTCSLIFALATVAYPAYNATQLQLSQTITQEEVSALSALRETTLPDATIIAPAAYGNYITAFAKRKNVIDSYFFLQPRINERYQDVSRLYKTTFETEAVELFDKYDATHLVVPPGMSDISYANSKCFARIHATNIRIYEKDVACEVRVVA